MNIKALIKTLTPSKQDVNQVIQVICLLAGLTVLMAIACAIVVGIYMALYAIFGEANTNGLCFALTVILLTWYLIIEPLVERYNRIKRKMEHE